jgi:8-oxo-dGTP pyrophosphatase MutT (NUDIX family)
MSYSLASRIIPSLPLSNRSLFPILLARSFSSSDLSVITDWSPASLALLQSRLLRWPRRRIVKPPPGAPTPDPNSPRSPAATFPMLSSERRAAVAISLVDENGVPSILYTKRADSLRSHKGQISFPGGICDSSDVDEVATALRELHEECGIQPAKVKVIGVHHDARAWSQHSGKGSIVSPVIVRIEDDIGTNPDLLRPNKDEVDFYFCVPIASLIDPNNSTKVNNWQAYKHQHRWIETQGATGDAEPRPLGTSSELVIWGASAHITKVFLEELIKPNK